MHYDGWSKGARSYKALAKEVEQRVRKEQSGNGYKQRLGSRTGFAIPTSGVEAEFDVTAKVDEQTGERTAADAVRQVAPALIDPNPHQPGPRLTSGARGAGGEHPVHRHFAAYGGDEAG